MKIVSQSGPCSERISSLGLFFSLAESKISKAQEKCFAEMLYLLQHAAYGCKLRFTQAIDCRDSLHPLPEFLP